MSAQDNLSPRQFIMPVADVLKMPSAEGYKSHETVEQILPMKRAENNRQLAEGEPFALRRQALVQSGDYKAPRVNAKGQLRDGHHTLAMVVDAGHKTVRMTGGWRPWRDKDEDAYDESYELTQEARGRKK